MQVHLESVTSDSVDIYIKVGEKSYRQHYLHLWPNEDPTNYISTSFTRDVVSEELKDSNMENFLVKTDEDIVGILKLIWDKALDEYSAEKSLLVEKVYLLNEYSGKGYGAQLFDLIEVYAKKLGKTLIWLDTMQKGAQLNFYQKNGYEIKRASLLTLPGAKEEERPMWIMTKKI
ncbi:GNAT family N-acetyltransferase [Flagellimonas allohymeniacidonis]|uniref:GNAT family N-acetyltransferase n=1 Tax=Flagellimonas allohymeniacidonis TaxID=2517819 RepID=UPI0013EED57A|nr:GNAT family N-acetyltransferase [Allomuricauda hymeniacidonis]